jgi:hypothetical protein
MSKAPALLLHRDDPDKPPLVGHVKVTREDWLNVAWDILISEGVGQVKVLGIAARQDAITKMFERYGYDPAEADIRARVLYYQQIGYYALDLAETLEERLTRVEGYLYCFTGVLPTAEEVADFRSFSRSVDLT